MSNPAENLGELERLAKSSVWRLIEDTISERMGKEMIPQSITGTLDEIAIATIGRAARYTAFEWVRNRMLTEMIAREKKVLAE